MLRTALLIAILFTLTGCVDRAAQKLGKKTEELVTDTTVPVKVAAVTQQDLQDTFEVTGAIATSESSSVGPNVSGRLVAVYVKDGDPVKAGQAIAQQETEDATARLRQAQAGVSSALAALQQATNNAAVGPTKSDAGVKAALAQLAQAKAQYEKAKNGSRPEERAQAEWSVKRAKSDLDTAKSNLDRTKKLFADGAVAEVDVEAAQNRYDNALSAYNAAEQSLKIVLSATRPEDLAAAKESVAAAEEAVRTAKANQKLDPTLQEQVHAARANLQSAQEQVRLAQKAVSDATIRSPFNGRVSGRPVQAGTFVAPGSVIANIVGGTGSYFEANVPETKVTQVRPGAPVTVQVDALGNTNLQGEVIAINPQASTQGRLFTVRIAVHGAEGQLKPGMFARGQLLVGVHRGATVVPTQAVLKDGEDSYIFLAEGDKAKRVKVSLGLQTDGLTEVTGVPQGASIIVTGQATLVDGAKIKVEASKKGV